MLPDPRSPRGFACASAVTAALLLTPMVLASPAARAATAAPVCGAVILPGSAWLGGLGVDVHHNVHVGGSTASCAPASYSNPAVQYGGGWQCVELAARLYYVRGWGAVWTGGNGGAQYIPEGSPGLEFHANGSGYRPVPGDLVIEWGGTYGHVSVVNTMTATSIEAIEQNVSVAATHSYPFQNGVATGGYFVKGVRGFMHSPLNRATNPVPHASPAATKPATPVINKVRKGHQKVGLKWSADAGSPTITSTQIWVRTYVAPGVTDGGRVITLSAATRKADVTGLSAGTKYRFNVRRTSATAIGNWSNGRNSRPLP